MWILSPGAADTKKENNAMRIEKQNHYYKKYYFIKNILFWQYRFSKYIICMNQYNIYNMIFIV